MTIPLCRKQTYSRSAAVSGHPHPSRKCDQWDVVDVDNWETLHFALADKLWMIKAQRNIEHLAPVTPSNNPSYLSRSSLNQFCRRTVDRRSHQKPVSAAIYHSLLLHTSVYCLLHVDSSLLSFKSKLLVEWLFKLAYTTSLYRERRPLFLLLFFIFKQHYYSLLLVSSLVSVWRYQRLCNAILTSWWWTHVLETCRGMK